MRLVSALGFLQLVGRHYGFLGIEGFAGIIVGAIILIFLCLILFKLVALVAAKLGADAGWQQIIYWLLVLLVFVLFLHLFGLY
jgi:hypothetical protein